MFQHADEPGHAQDRRIQATERMLTQEPVRGIDPDNTDNAEMDELGRYLRLSIDQIFNPTFNWGSFSVSILLQVRNQIQEWNEKKPSWAEGEERRCADCVVWKKKSRWPRKSEFIAGR